MQSRYACHAQASQVSSDAQPRDITVAFMVSVILTQFLADGFHRPSLRASACAAVAAFLGAGGRGNIACWLLQKAVFLLKIHILYLVLKVRKRGSEHKAARGRKVLF